MAHNRKRKTVHKVTGANLWLNKIPQSMRTRKNIRKVVGYNILRNGIPQSMHRGFLSPPLTGRGLSLFSSRWVCRKVIKEYHESLGVVTRSVKFTIEPVYQAWICD